MQSDQPGCTLVETQKLCVTSNQHLQLVREAIKKKNLVKLGTLSQVASHPPLPTDAYEKEFQTGKFAPISDIIKEKQL
jgi:hypothetical protein